MMIASCCGVGRRNVASAVTFPTTASLLLLRRRSIVVPASFVVVVVGSGGGAARHIPPRGAPSPYSSSSTFARDRAAASSFPLFASPPGRRRAGGGGGRGGRGDVGRSMTFSTSPSLSSPSSSPAPSGGASDGASAAAGTASPNRTGDRDGLLRHVVVADDGHPLRLYSRSPRLRPPPTGSRRSRSILLLHGRTWSSQPVWDVRASPDDIEGLSTLQSLADLGYDAFALDFRGFGETPRDHRNYRGYTTPNRCVDDVGAAMDWIADRHRRRRGGRKGEEGDCDDDDDLCDTRPALLGWSQGALVAQLYAQRPHAASKMTDLILYGSIYDPSVVHPRRPLFDPISTAASSSTTSSTSSSAAAAPEVPNTEIASLEDFTIPGTVTGEAAYAFASLALQSDPIKAAWDELHEFDSCDPCRVSSPTLVVVGSRDPYVNWDAQARLFGGLGTEDRAMVVVPGCDHAVHLLEARGAFVRAVAGFLERNGDGP